jgi:hypothetical protein
MYGGHVSRAFFSGQCIEFDKWFRDELPPQEYSNEETEAGFQKLNETFGFYATLDMIARYVGEDDERLVKKWSVMRFYTKVRYLAWRAHTQKEYSRLMEKK